MFDKVSPNNFHMWYVHSELLTCVPVTHRNKNIGIQQWWYVLRVTSFLSYTLFIVNINQPVGLQGLILQ